MDSLETFITPVTYSKNITSYGAEVNDGTNEIVLPVNDYVNYHNKFFSIYIHNFDMFPQKHLWIKLDHDIKFDWNKYVYIIKGIDYTSVNGARVFCCDRVLDEDSISTCVLFNFIMPYFCEDLFIIFEYNFEDKLLAIKKPSLTMDIGVPFHGQYFCTPNISNFHPEEIAWYSDFLPFKLYKSTSKASGVDLVFHRSVQLNLCPLGQTEISIFLATDFFKDMPNLFFLRSRFAQLGLTLKTIYRENKKVSFIISNLSRRKVEVKSNRIIQVLHAQCFDLEKISDKVEFNDKDRKDKKFCAIVKI